MGRPREYSDAERQEAIEVWRTKGASAAARQIGVSRTTIYNWVNEAEAQGTQDRDAIYEHKRKEIRYKLINRVFFILDQMKSPHEETYHYQGSLVFNPLELPKSADIRNYAQAAQVLMDMILMEEGKPTSRVETIDPNILDQELEKLAGELADRATGKEIQEIPPETDVIQKLRNMEESDEGSTS